MPGDLVLVIPMAMLLGTLLAMQRLSGESEITAMKAGGNQLFADRRAVAGRRASSCRCVALFLQEGLVPFANDQVNYIEKTSSSTSRVRPRSHRHPPLPGGGRQVTIAASLRSTPRRC